jgi:hypothetical protein
MITLISIAAVTLVTLLTTEAKSRTDEFVIPIVPADGVSNVFF